MYTYKYVYIKLPGMRWVKVSDLPLFGLLLSAFIITNTPTFFAFFLSLPHLHVYAQAQIYLNLKKRLDSYRNLWVYKRGKGTQTFSHTHAPTHIHTQQHIWNLRWFHMKKSAFLTLVKNTMHWTDWTDEWHNNSRRRRRKRKKGCERGNISSSHVINTKPIFFRFFSVVVVVVVERKPFPFSHIHYFFSPHGAANQNALFAILCMY